MTPKIFCEILDNIGIKEIWSNERFNIHYDHKDACLLVCFSRINFWYMAVSDIFHSDKQWPAKTSCYTVTSTSLGPDRNYIRFIFTSEWK